MAIDPQTDYPPVLVLHGSQKGQAQAIAEEVFETARQEFSLETEIACLSQPDIIERLRIGGFVVFVVSTTGEGEPPDKMRKFWRTIKRKDLSPNYLCNLKYALLGLGDSNYTNFCAMGKNLNQRLLSLGAEPFYEAGFADDGTGLEVIVDPWVDNIWQAFKVYTKAMHKSKRNPIPSECTPLLHEILHETLSHQRNGTDSPSSTDKLPKIPLLRHNSSPEYGTISHLSNGTLFQDSTPANGFSAAQTDLKLSLAHAAPLKFNPITKRRTNSLNQISDQLTSKLRIFQQTNQENSFQSPNSKTDVEIPLIPQSALGSLTSFQPNFSLSMSDTVRSGQSESPDCVASPAHSEERLTTPSHQPHYLDCEILQATEPCPEFRTHPIFPNDTISTCDLVSSRLLSDTEHYPDVKRVIELELLINDPFGFQAGDAVGILCPNDELEVEYLLGRLDLLTVRDSRIRISVVPFNSKNGAIIPAYIPSRCTVRELFLHHLDIRSVPRKSVLWMLAQYTSNFEEKYRLSKLSSKEGSVEYTALIRDQSATLMDILHSFPSCNPPLVRLIEMLLPLNPRYYSICNSPITSDNRIKIVFSVVRQEDRPWHPSKRFGLCTGWLDRLATQFMNETPKPKLRLSIISRMFNGFHLPEDPCRPILMVGPGTGVAPFIGFLDHREHLQQDQGKKLGISLLFFGCKYKEGDFLFRGELDKFESSKVLSELHLSFSREEGAASRYVQDNMARSGERLVALVRDENAVFYLCGDAKNMAPDVRQTWMDILQKYGGMEKEEATLYIKKLQKEKRYIQDVWL